MQFKKLNRISDSSFSFVRVADGKEILGYNTDQSLTPASVTKMITAAAALDALGPDFTFKTKIFYEGIRKTHHIEGNLIIQGSGDPFLVTEKLWQAAADLKNMGIKKITGNLVIDNSLFQNNFRDASRVGSLKSSNNAYDAPLTALALNFNTLALAVAPVPGQKRPLVSLDPHSLDSVEIINKIRTTTGKKSGFRVTRNFQNNRTKLYASGRIGSQNTIKKVYRSVSNPVQISGELFKSFLHAEGVEIAGSVAEGAATTRSKELTTITSYPLSYIISGLNKYSNNFIADMLTLYLGAKFGDGATMAGGAAYLAKFLKSKVGIAGSFAIYNGSGLDTRNKLSTRQLTKLLQFVSRRIDIFPEFLASLPISGRDGTLANRFKLKGTRELQGLIRAKTGTLTQPHLVSTLAGFFSHEKHGLVAFAIFSNSQPSKKKLSILDVQYQQELALEEFM